MNAVLAVFDRSSSLIFTRSLLFLTVCVWVCVCVYRCLCVRRIILCIHVTAIGSTILTSNVMNNR